MSPTTVPWPPPPKLAACPRCGLQITQAAVELGFSLFDGVGTRVGSLTELAPFNIYPHEATRMPSADRWTVQPCGHDFDGEWDPAQLYRSVAE